MAYNINDVSGNSVATEAFGTDGWTFTADLSDTSMTVVSGDFDQVSFFGANQGEAADGYAFSPLSTDAYGSLNFNTADGTFSFSIDRAAVLASNSDQTVTFTVVGSSGGQSDSDTVTINILLCVARDTRIETARGAVPVQTLRAGDLILTRDAGYQPIRWIGTRKIGADELAAKPALRPIRIKAGAFGDAVPSRDLLVSPQHKILLSDWHAELLFGEDEILAPAKGLVNDRSIYVDRQVAEIEYFHILFDRHQIICTNGTQTESFCPGSYSLNAIDAAARDELLEIFPNLATDDNSYGPTARYSVKMRETRLLGAIGATIQTKDRTDERHTKPNREPTHRG